MQDGAALDAMERAMLGAVEHSEGHPLDWIDWTIRQAEYVALTSWCAYSLFRAGNQVGKTYVGAALTIWACLGYHPGGALTRPPIEAWVVCTSWSQAVAIMATVWDLCPKDVLAPGQTFDRRRGFGKDNPALVFANGSIIRFRTTNQGAGALAGSTVDWIWIDEPTDEAIYRELQKRVMRRAGRLIITLTPVNRDCSWLAEMVTRGAIREVHARLDTAALTFSGSGELMTLLDGTPMDAAWIAEQRRVTPPLWVPVVLDGEWDAGVQGVFFANFDPAVHVSAAVRLRAPATAKLRWMLGIDYAAADRDYGQCAILCRVLEVPRANGGGVDCWIYVVDEVVLGGAADSDEFAAELAAMLDRQGIQWSQIAYVHGDNPVASRWEEKSNVNTMRSMAQRLRVPQKALKPRILNAKDGVRSSGSLTHGCRYVYAALAKRRLMIHPRCTHLTKGLQTWDFTIDHPYKDVIDALRYALKRLIFPGGGSSHVSVRVAA